MENLIVAQLVKKLPVLYGTVRFITVFTRAHPVALGGLVVVLATGPKVRGFKPGRGRWIFKDDKNP
jgi:hypothetical protein